MQKVWLSEYQEGVAHEINPDEYSSLVSFFNECCNKFADNIAYMNFGTSITYKQLQQKVNKFSAYLQQELQLKKGDKLAIMMPNLLQYPIAMFAALKAGLTVVNVNPLYTPRELLHQVNDACAETIIVMENFASTVQSILEASKLKNIIITRLGDLHGQPKGFIMNLVNKYIKKNVVNYKLNNKINFMQALEHNLSFNEVDVDNQDIAFLQYTGGTTGVAKGAILTHRNILANLSQGSTWLKPKLSIGKEIVITPLPMYHIFSLTANCLMFFKLGAKNILITNPKDIKGFIKELQGIKFSVITGVNTLFNGLLNQPAFAKLDFSKLKLSLGGGMAVQENVAKKWYAVTNNILLEAYGLTESSPAVSINPMNLKEYNGSIGLPLPSTDISIRDQHANKLSFDEVGELWVKGPQVMRGYWNKPEEDELVFHDGWLKTGDMAYVNERGYIYIVDRLKDMILVSGFNVYPNEIEETIAAHPLVNEVGVVGMNLDDSKEQVVAFVTVNDASLTIEQLRQHCIDNLTAYKVPKQFMLLEDLPKTNVGKISRKDLKELAKQQLR